MEDKTLIRLAITTFTITTLILARTFAVGANHFYVSNAILAHKMVCIHKFHTPSLVGYDDMEEFGTTWLRLWDWSSKRILDTEKYLAIKPYIGEVVWY
jgi:hypothetical protein